MSLSIRMQPRQQQALVMTPQLLQSIRLLQLGHQDLRAFLQREAERNPLIQLAAATPPRAPSSATGGPPGGQGTSATARQSGSVYRPEPGDAADSQAPSLEAHAVSEIRQLVAAPADRRIAAHLLLHLDDSGYLRTDGEETARALGLPQRRVADVLERLRNGAEPAGLFARDLAQCLGLQLARLDRLDPVAELVLQRLDLLARGDWAALCRLTGEDRQGLAELAAEIRALDPKPGLSFADAEPVATLEPDISVRREGAGWSVELNAGLLPRVLVNERYRRSILSGCRTQVERDFVSDCQANASWLARALDQRARSILKVASEIVAWQPDFPDAGLASLRPMTLGLIAGRASLHESTVSRVIANKFIATPIGTFELKSLFTAALASSQGGDAHSAAGVKERIRRLVSGETPGRVLSDDDIAAALHGEGVAIARRTVAKYREGLGIPSSVQRRREFGRKRLAS